MYLISKRNPNDLDVLNVDLDQSNNFPNPPPAFIKILAIVFGTFGGLVLLSLLAVIYRRYSWDKQFKRLTRADGLPELRRGDRVDMVEFEVEPFPNHQVSQTPLLPRYIPIDNNNHLSNTTGNVGNVGHSQAFQPPNEPYINVNDRTRHTGIENQVDRTRQEGYDRRDVQDGTPGRQMNTRPRERDIGDGPSMGQAMGGIGTTGPGRNSRTRDGSGGRDNRGGDRGSGGGGKGKWLFRPGNRDHADVERRNAEDEREDGSLGSPPGYEQVMRR
ncbi:hypothetical protein M231_05742 [Tremella mesenterica]|uniref:Uncharacterized protein n=1 Tax=Tremella mesenterica TaxID=5217 RepID=A0A4Q1BHA6_TREME|nr:hypothetical protein M231_05742 [Tremella mesenterica]